MEASSMALAIDFQESLRRASCVVDFLAELEWQDRILIAMHDKDRNVNGFELCSVSN